MPKKSQLTVKPLSAWNLPKLKVHQIQSGDLKDTIALFRNGYPAHQAMFYDGKKSILACGFIDMSGGQFYAWTVFGESFTKMHYRFFVKYVNDYLSLLNYSSIHHIIRKDLPWTRKMISMVGFQYVRDEDEQTEHWVRLK